MEGMPALVVGAKATRKSNSATKNAKFEFQQGQIDELQPLHMHLCSTS
jgi:hypothetical protein